MTDDAMGKKGETGMVERIVSTAIGGSMIGFGLSRKSVGGAALAAAGGLLAYHGVTGQGPNVESLDIESIVGDPTEGVVAERSMTIAMPRDEVYGRWRRLEELPQFMRHVKEVRVLDDVRSHWVAQATDDHGTVEWDAEIIDDRAGERLAWRSLPEAEIENSGEVRFEDSPGGHGTEIHVRIEYRPPGGAAGAAVAKMLNRAFEQIVKEDIRRFKQLAETGELATTEGQPSGR